MKFLDILFQILNKPFPEEETRAAYFRTVAAVSIFITLFLYIFRPFDMSNLESDRFLTCLGFGGMTFIAVVFYDLVICPVFRLKESDKKFTFGKWILHMIATMIVISVANFIYIRLLFFGDIRWEFFHFMLLNTFAIGIFPVVTLGGIALMRQEKKYQHIADEINQKQPIVPTSSASNDRSVFSIPLTRIRYIEALQNYVKIGHLNAEGRLTEQTERTTLKSILEETEGSPIVQCHRSFLVNRDAIITTSGNAQGLLLTLKDCDKAIPVSRGYVSVFRGT